MATPDPFEGFQFPISEEAAYLARVHVGVTIPLLALCLVPFCARMYVRIRPVWRLAWDDLFIILGLVGSPPRCHPSQKSMVCVLVPS